MKLPEYQPTPEPLHSSEQIFLDILNGYDGKVYWHERKNQISQEQMKQLDPVIRRGIVEDFGSLVIGEIKRLGNQVKSDGITHEDAMRQYFQRLIIAAEEFEKGDVRARVPSRPSKTTAIIEQEKALKALIVLRMYDMTHTKNKAIADYNGWKTANPKQLLEIWSDKGREYISSMIVAGETSEARALREVALSLLPTDAELSLAMRRQIKKEEIAEKGLTPDVLRESLLEDMPIHRDVMRVYHQKGIKSVGAAVNTSFSLEKGNEVLSYLVRHDMNYLRTLLGLNPQY